MIRYRCNACGWIGDEHGILRAPHPFKEGIDVEGCPRCKEMGPFDFHFRASEPEGHVQIMARKKAG